jgi:DNA polymerase I
MAETLYLIDGYAQIFRAYYAIRGGMRSPVTGESTHAVFGFTGMLLRLLSELDARHVVVAMDAPGRTFRDDLYGAYKATRDAIPDDLQAQVPRVLEVVEAFGIPVIGQAGLEADDVIATIVQRVLDDPACAGLDVRIISKDKDLEQLLCDRVALFDIHTGATIDVAALWENKGITPGQVIDVLALTGDTVDNVPGVDGIGLKTAAQLIGEFGSIEGILAGLDRIKGKRRENLEKAREHLPLSRALVTLRRDASVSFSLEASRVCPVDLERLLALFQQLGFNRYQEEARRLAGGPPASAGPAAAGSGTPAAAGDDLPEVVCSFDLVDTPEELEKLARALGDQALVGLRTRTARVASGEVLRGLAFAWDSGRGVYLPVLSPETKSGLDPAVVAAVLGPVLSSAAVPKCGHNLKQDARALLRHGIRLRGVICDAMLACTLIDPALPAHKLDHLARSLLGCRLAEPAEGGAEEAARCAVAEAIIGLRLHQHVMPRLDQMGLGRLFREIEAPLCVVLAEMEANGITCDPEELLRQKEALGIRAEALRREVLALAGCDFHLDSTRQLAEVLFDRLGLQVVKKTRTGRSTDIQVLEALAAEEDPADPRTGVPRLIIEYRHLTKLLTTYMGQLREAVHPETRRIHCTFHQIYTATGRMVAHNPNLQTIPVRTEVGRQIRKAFSAPGGHVLICADYSQVELRILAHLSEDPGLLRAFEQDLDIHAAVAAEVFGAAPGAVTREQRSHAKTINFGIIYGVTAYGLSRRIEGLDVSGAKQLIADYRERFPGIERFLQRCVRDALEEGHVTTLMGRRRSIPEIRSGNRHTRALGERLAINSVVQGSGADLIKAAMVNVQRRIDRERLPLKLLLQIHDELVFETPAEAAEEHAAFIREEMERAAVLKVPLKAEAGIGRDWMSAK